MVPPDRNEKIYALELEGRELRSTWTRTEGLLEEEREYRRRLEETVDSLYEQVGYFKEQLLSAQQRAADAEGRCQQLEAQLDPAGALLQPEDQPIAGSLDEFSGQVDGAALTGQQNDRFSMDTAATGTETAASSPPVNQATSQVAWMLRPADHIAEDQSDRVHSDYDVQPQQLWREDVASAADTEAVTPGRDRCGSLNEPDEIAFADWLADALRREDMTMEEAALQIGVSVKTFSRWVGGITEPGLRDLRRLRDFFGDFPFP